ncbi:outer membrane beta-barrel protein [Membranihabitans marinus]|uniref:outer membrane beta-barrel protein n=1 Tax=Membranihabitans marinus TaxID=1227546 RepID=UPI001F2681D9|nr:outer membrane beta-barrel protein [Membranihabitans marinus]
MRFYIGFLCLVIVCRVEAQSPFEFTLSFNATKVQTVHKNSEIKRDIWGPATNAFDNTLKPTFGLTAGLEMSLLRKENLRMQSGLRYNLMGSRADVELPNLDNFVMHKSVYAHYLQIPLSVQVTILDPFYFYAGASYNYAFNFGKDFSEIYSPYLNRSDVRVMGGLGWKLIKFSIFAEYEESLFHYGKILKDIDSSVVEPISKNLRIGISIPLDSIKSK